MSDTPRTDAFHDQTHLNPSSAYAAVLQHARRLESELADAQQRIREWRDMAEKYDKSWSAMERELMEALVAIEQHRERAERAIDRETALRDALALERATNANLIRMMQGPSKADSADGQSG